MSELQLKLERRRKSIADAESGARLDEAVTGSKLSGAISAVAPNEMIAKLEKRRSQIESSSLPVNPSADTAMGEPEVCSVDAIVVDDPRKSDISSKNSASEMDSIPASGRPPIAAPARPTSSKLAKAVSAAEPSSPLPSASSSDLPNCSSTSCGQNDCTSPVPNSPPVVLVKGPEDVGPSAAHLVLPWMQGVNSLRERRTPHKSSAGSNVGLIEAQAKQHKRRQSIKSKLSSSFDVDKFLVSASVETLVAIGKELEVEMGPGAFGLAVRRLYGQRAVARLRQLPPEDSVALQNIVLECALKMGPDAFRDAVDQLHLSQARDSTLMETDRLSEGVGAAESDPDCVPFKFMSYDHETGVWSIPPDAAIRIDSLAKKGQGFGSLRVIGAIGGIHKGKSFLLNRLAGRQTGFAVGRDAAGTCTEGVWAWFVPDTNILLLDCAGMFDQRRRNKKLDEQLFLCAAALSSLLVYNTMGSVDENALCDIGSASRMVKTFYRKEQKLRAGAEPKPEGELPILVWLIRDFSLSLASFDGSCDSYLKKQLVLVKDNYMDNRITITNTARQSITNMFSDIHCLTMSKPFVSKEVLSHLDAFPFQNLPADFQISTNATVEAILAAAPEKVFSQLPESRGELDGALGQLAASPLTVWRYAEALCDVLNGRLPMDANSVWEHVQQRLTSNV